ncbi:hypothetical protein [Psychromicrobium lacuslunae]|uniref:DUF4253 domain-containing protein n=1 Tax=Psychromicrobium lacuslunae TaxID=1618207 RepID=A0A0D4C204_9MICC|nr:hypothetical protein [Psychromicrobium lacuslunae]AJT42445.1 hypothetical protein UM93_14775 [Psychromicrobium lacuslunae]
MSSSLALHHALQAAELPLPAAKAQLRGHAIAIWTEPTTNVLAFLALHDSLKDWRFILLGSDPSVPVQDLIGQWQELSAGVCNSFQGASGITEAQALAEFGVSSLENSTLATQIRSKGPNVSESANLSGTLIAVQIISPATLPALFEWEGADNLGSRAALSALLARWQRLWGAELFRLSDTDEATLSLLIRNSGRISEKQLALRAELLAACDELRVTKLLDTADEIYELWWD